ncbi:MAG: UDP-glucose 4-epimerase GalE [Pedobacter sp.]|nr:MAG: UDP-glucose 4-epimerase GalE [Pedobacter sp.]
MAKILVTGGTGYIGSHTVVELFNAGYEVVVVDDFSNSDPKILDQIEKISGKKPTFVKLDLCDESAVKDFAKQHSDLDGIIHFAAFKAVGESVQQPLKYYRNNFYSLINIITAYNSEVKLVFSSSCTVYGQPDVLPVTETAAVKKAESPYGNTKQIAEEILAETCAVTPSLNVIALRYFNPVGAHKSALIGELPIGKPQNLVPAITQTAIGKIPKMTVHGTDYPTRDGSCVRDYIHVMDIAHAHTLSIKYLQEKRNAEGCEIFNLGTGNGVTVLEAIQAFEKVSGEKLNYETGPRRTGDVVAIYANNDKAKTQLGWDPQRSLEEMMSTAWKWEVKLKEDEKLFTSAPSQLN